MASGYIFTPYNTIQSVVQYFCSYMSGSTFTCVNFRDVKTIIAGHAYPKAYFYFTTASTHHHLADACLVRRTDVHSLH